MSNLTHAKTEETMATMQIRVLGCSGAIARNARTTSFLLGERILLDAGTGVGDLTVEEMLRIEHVLITHSHLDHIAALPLMLDAMAGALKRTLVVHALPATIEAMRAHIFNNVIWPDFSCLPSVERPFMRFNAIEVGDVLELAGHRVEVLPARHTVPAAGYALDTPSGQWVFTGDTCTNPAFWHRVNDLKLAMLVIETAFSEREHGLALSSQHLSPSLLLNELAQLDLSRHQGLRIGITHTKPAEHEQIRHDLAAIGLNQRYPLVWLEAGQCFEF